MDEQKPTGQPEASSELIQFFKLLSEQLGRKDFATIYANNFQFEPSVWDLKIVFGQLDQQIGAIVQRLAQTVGENCVGVSGIRNYFQGAFAGQPVGDVLVKPVRHGHDVYRPDR